MGRARPLTRHTSGEHGRARASWVTVGGMQDAPRVVGLVGVYDADGGLVGEARYVVGHLLGLVDCALCDITHSPVRRKPAWDRMVAGLGVAFRLRHRNELADQPAVAAAVRSVGLPLVLARLDDGAVRPVLDRTALARLDGSVAAFDAELRAAVAAAGWAWPDPGTPGALARAPLAG